MSKDTQLAEKAPKSQALQVPPTPEAQAFALIQRQATMLAASTLVPKEFQDNVSNCAIALEIANRLRCSAFMVMQNIDIIHGRPAFRATFLIAMVNACGRFAPLMFRMEGEGQSRSCTAYTKVLATGETVEGPMITMAMAKAEGWSTKSGSKWLTMPELMLRYRSAAFFARIYASDVTLGMQTTEEVQEIVVRDITPPPASTSKLFQPKAETLDLIPDAPAIPALEAVKAWLADSSIEWQQINAELLKNGVLDDVRNNPDDCTDDELRRVLSAKTQIVAMVKGGG